ncbi:MAG: tetratricopeptide repeat protein [Proteobacteria bacterium]|nr:tetratricopeptide repeat protein [Pseudomonadota bacterium]
MQTTDQLIQLTNKKDALTSVMLTYLREGKKHDAVLQGGRIGIQINSLIPSQSEEINQIIEKGNQAFNLSRLQDALQQYQRALKLSQSGSYHQNEANSFYNLGNVYSLLSQNAQATEHYEASLAIFREIGDRQGEAQSINNLGVVQKNLSQFPQAIKHHEASLVIFREIGDRQGEASSLNNLGNVYSEALSQYPKAIEYFEDSLTISREIGDRLGEANSLHNLGGIYSSLNQYSQAIEYYKVSLAIAHEIGDRQGEERNLNNLGNVYLSLNQYSQAIEYHKASLALKREIANRMGEAASLNNLGLVYFNLSQYSQAIEHYAASLAIFREIGDRQGEATSLNNLGLVYSNLNQNSQSLQYNQQALAIQIQINAPDGLWRSWGSLFYTLQKLSHTESAIFAGKQAVNTLQGIRISNLGLGKNQQDSFLKDKTQVYHDLAALLIEQGRLAEAEQVMAMLKEEEYFDFIQRDSHEDVRLINAGYTSAEKDIAAELDQFDSRLSTLGKEYETLVKQSQIDGQTKARLSEIKKELEQVESGFFKLLSTAQDRLVQANKNVVAAEFDTPKLKELQQKVLDRHEAVFISTVITGDRLYLLLTTAQGQLARSSPISAVELGKLVSDFRNILMHPKSNLADLKDRAQELYAHLIRPLENDLQQIKPKNLMWALDGVLRYVPMAVLHDGKQFLIEQYGLSLYTAAAHSKWREARVDAWRAVGMGVSLAHPGFGALPAVPNELKSIIRQNNKEQTGVLPGEIYLDHAFNRATLESVIQKPENRVLHIASHFKLQPGNSSASELLLGDGNRLNLDEFRQQKAFELRNVDLLTLSACDTAIGERGTGGEIESFAVLAQRRGANGVLASLWRVEDESTALLMRQLYQLRSGNKPMSMAEALRQAQIALLSGEIRSGDHDYRHPYFWAPFVMMGNWL